MTTTKITRN